MISGICNLPLVPLRAQPSEQSEMVSQILFGELFELLEVHDSWSRIRICSDSYIGWCTSKMLQLFPDFFFDELSDKKPFLTRSAISVCKREDLSNGVFYLPAGSRLYLSDINAGIFELYHVDGEKVHKNRWQLADDASVEECDIVSLAMKFLNAPYLWGGKSVLGMDCSGLVQVVFSLVGVQLPRDARLQVLHGTLVSKISDILPGDLAFFANAEGKVVHVGICMGNGSIIHASGSVHVDRLDEQGIYCNNLAAYTHKLYQIKRILPVDVDYNQ